MSAVGSWKRWLTPQWFLCRQTSWPSLDEEEEVDLGNGWSFHVDWLGRSFTIGMGRLTPALRGPPHVRPGR